METSLSRAHLLREVRKMRFEEAYEGWQERRLTQEEAGRLLGMSAPGRQSREEVAEKRSFRGLDPGGGCR